MDLNIESLDSYYTSFLVPHCCALDAFNSQYFRSRDRSSSPDKRRKHRYVNFLQYITFSYRTIIKIINNDFCLDHQSSWGFRQSNNSRLLYHVHLYIFVCKEDSSQQHLRQIMNSSSLGIWLGLIANYGQVASHSLVLTHGRKGQPKLQASLGNKICTLDCDSQIDRRLQCRLGSILTSPQALTLTMVCVFSS